MPKLAARPYPIRRRPRAAAAPIALGPWPNLAWAGLQLVRLAAIAAPIGAVLALVWSAR